MRLRGTLVSIVVSVALVGLAPAVAAQTDPPAVAGEENLGPATESTNAAELQRFQSEPTLRPPVLDVDVAPPGPRPGLLFTTTNQYATGVGDQVNIYDDTGEVVYSRLVDGATADFKVVEYDGAPALAFYEGEPLFGNGRYVGEWTILDSSYEEVARFSGTGFEPDLHDLVLYDAETGPRALLLIYSPVTMDLTSLGGQPDATVLELVIQEVDVDTGDVLFEWHSLDHVGVDESVTDVTGDVVDYIHGNSLEIDDDGGIIASARNTSTVYKIDRTTGDVEWRLGGTENDFTMVGTQPEFALQHDARRNADGSLSVYDNSGLGSQSRALAYTIDETTMTATVLRDQRAPGGHYGATMGNASFLDDGSLLIGWGSGRRYTEFAANGSVISDGHFPSTASYRVHRQPWVATPSSPPKVAVRSTATTTQVYASWNGATEVDRWRVSQVTESGDVVLDEVPRDGFETTIEIDLEDVDCDQPIRVDALDDEGSVIGSSDLSAACTAFFDVSTSHPFYADIEWMAAQGISYGFPDGSYQPSIPVTRQAMAAFMYRLAGEPDFVPEGQSFSDVPSSHPFYAEIEWLAAEGISQGYPEGSYQPSVVVTRQAMAAFLYRLAGEPDFVPEGQSFSDVGAGHPFYAEIEWMAAEGISLGFGDGSYRPSVAVTRQAMAAFMHRFADGPGVGT